MKGAFGFLFNLEKIFLLNGYKITKISIFNILNCFLNSRRSLIRTFYLYIRFSVKVNVSISPSQINADKS